MVEAKVSLLNSSVTACTLCLLPTLLATFFEKEYTLKNKKIKKIAIQCSTSYKCPFEYISTQIPYIDKLVLEKKWHFLIPYLIFSVKD